MLDIKVAPKKTLDRRSGTDRRSAFSNDKNNRKHAARDAILKCGFRASGQGHDTVVGTRGLIDVAIAFVPPSVPTPIIFADACGAHEELVPGVDRYALEAEAFADALSHGKPAQLTPEDAIGNMRAIDALRASARSNGRRVSSETDRESSVDRR